MDQKSAKAAQQEDVREMRPTRFMSDVDIALIRAHLNCNVMGASTQSAPRHWLSAEDNREVVNQVNKFWSRLDAHYLQLSNTVVSDRPVVESLNQSILSYFVNELKAGGIERFFGSFSIDGKNPDGSKEIAFSEALPYSPMPVESEEFKKSPDGNSISTVLNYESRDVIRCVTRDLERGWDTFSRLANMEQTPEENKKEITKTLNNEFEKSAQEKNSFFSPAMSGLYEQTGTFKISLGSLASFIKKSVSQEDIDDRRLKLSERFGLDGVTISSSLMSNPRQHLKWLGRVEKDLEKACKRLGIDEKSFGMDGRSSLEIDSPRTSFQKKMDATFSTFSKDNARVNLSASAHDGPACLVHEYIHHLDNVLALKVRQSEPGLFEDSDNTEFFSEMSLLQKSALPLASKGLEQICQQTHKHTLLDQVNRWIEKIIPKVGNKEDESVNKSNLGTGPIRLNDTNEPAKKTNESKSGILSTSSSESLNSFQISKLTEKALDRFALVHLGPQGFLKMSSQEHAQYKESLKRNGGPAILEMAKGWSRLSMEEISACVDSSAATGEHMSIARKLHGPCEIEHRRNAILSIEPMLVSLNARLNFLTQSAVASQTCAESNQKKIKSIKSHDPGVMMESSVRRDRQGIDAGKNSDYYTQPKEILARILSRPHGLDQVLKKIHTPYEITPMSHGQLRELSKGLEKMLDCAGVPRSAKPALSEFLEPQKFAVAKVANGFANVINEFANVINEVTNLAPRMSAMFAMRNENRPDKKISGRHL